MKNNQYFDEYGNRIKLDTCFIERHGNPNRVHRMTGKERQSVFRSLFSAGMFGFCAWFVFAHCGVIWKEMHTIVEFIGVAACGAYMALCIERFLKKLED